MGRALLELCFGAGAGFRPRIAKQLVLRKNPMPRESGLPSPAVRALLD
jgi:hypothetical protein